MASKIALVIIHGFILSTKRTTHTSYGAEHKMFYGPIWSEEFTVHSATDRGIVKELEVLKSQALQRHKVKDGEQIAVVHQVIPI